MSFFKKVIFVFLIVVTVTAVSLGLCEAVVRGLLGEKIALFPRFVISMPHGHFRIRSNSPGMVYRHRSSDGQWEVRVNRQGFRADRDYPEQKLPGVKRILLLGDSFTMASEVSIEDSFGAILEKGLREKGYKVEVINTGVSGYSTSEALIVLENNGLKFQPDVVILGFFTNDYKDNLRSDLYRLEKGKLTVHKREYAPGGRIQNFLRRFSWYSWVSQHSYFYNYLNRVLTISIKEKLEEENALQIQQALGIKDIQSYQTDLAFSLVKKISEETHRHNAVFVLMDIPTFFGENSIRFSDRFQNGVDLFVEVRALFQNIKNWGLLYRPHGDRHWTELAHRMVGEYLAEKIALIFVEEHQRALEVLLKKSGFPDDE